MIGFIWKDVLTLRAYLMRQLGLMLLAAISISIGLRNFGMLPTAMIVCFVISLVSGFSLDECAQWDSFALTLPVSRRAVIQAKYTVFLGGLLLVSLVSGVVSAGLSMLLFGTGGKELLLISGGLCLAFIPVLCLSLPLFVKLGVEKARLWMVLIILAPFFGFFILMQNREFSSAVLGGKLSLSLTAGQMMLYGVLVLAVLVLCVMVSCRISVKLYEAKEF